MSTRLTAPHGLRLNNFLYAGLLTSCLLATPCAAWTIDVTPDTTQYLSDPSFIPKQWQIFSETTYSRTDVDEDFRTSAGTIQSHYSATGNHYAEALAFGITDRLSVHASGEYFSRNTTNAYTNGPTINGSNSQFENPSFGVTYRAITQPSNPVSVDIHLDYAPPAVNSAPQSGSVSFDVNREMKSFTVQAAASVSYNASYQSPINGSVEGYWTYSTALRGQYRIVDRVSINSGLVYYGQSDTTYGGYTGSFGPTISPYVTLNVDIWPSHANLAFEYDHYFLGDETFGGSASGAWVNQSENLYAVHLRLLF